MTDPNKAPKPYTIGGITVQFPHKAYPSQVAMMAKIIQSLKNSQNCLLESPTGSGKSLALLCGALAWQKAEIQKVIEYNQAFRDDDDDDFCTDGYNPPPRIVENDKPVPSELTKPVQVAQKPGTKKVPKIYFGTRTHKQITQIIRELRKTEYSDVKMTILGSRSHTCIEPNVSKEKNKDAACEELNKELGGCAYKTNVKNKLGDHTMLNQYRGRTQAWDMEDLVKVGKKVRACPFFAVRELVCSDHSVEISGFFCHLDFT